MRILLAEDDAASRQVIAAQLQKLGHEVVEAEDGEAAWVAFQQEKPQVVITDWMMPRADGPELCRRIREANRPEYVFVILLTAMERKIGYVEGMNAGADDFVTKPCDTIELDVRLRVARRILALQTEVRQLEGLLPICPTCKKIQDENKEWQVVEAYIMERTDAQFSHGICPECFEKYMKPQLEQMRKARR
jgi:sigma-B regulation protein RsbU (phosphoserine phosphatase)